MKNTKLIVIGATLVLMSMASVSNAAVTCKIIPSWCPDKDTSHDNDGHGNSNGKNDTPRTSVPEPSSLLLLGGGVAAMVAAVRRRKNK